MYVVTLTWPLVLLGLMLLMERVERPLRHRDITAQLEMFLDTARPDEVERFVSDGFGPAIESYWSSRRPAGRV